MRVKVWSRVPSLSALRRSATLVNNKWAELRPFTFVIIGDTCSLTVTVYHFLLFTGFVWTGSKHSLGIYSMYISIYRFFLIRFLPFLEFLLIVSSISLGGDGHENLRSREWLLFQAKNTDLDSWEREPSEEPSKENLWNFVMQYSDS